VNSLFVTAGIESWKAVLGTLLLPPVPLLLMVLIGMRLVRLRRGLGGFIALLGLALLWLTACWGTADIVSDLALKPPAAITRARIQALNAAAKRKEPIAIMVLGGGAEAHAPEYGLSNLRQDSIERLRYGIWLGRETGLPVGFAGGSGHAEPDVTPEAQVAARIATEEFRYPLRWLEDRSRDTRENAARSVALLRPLGIKHIVLVTQGFHMPRAMRAFSEAAGTDMRVEAAPMSLAQNFGSSWLRWAPSSSGFTRMRNVLHELIGLAAGS
jgi:uncharacterized SAM-binding protein YcdF (DUF218 family)